MGNDRLGRYAEGLTALMTNGILPPNPQQARKIFRELFEIRPDDSVGLASRYYLIQVEKELTPEFDAKASYLRFFQAYPTTFFGGLSVVKYAMMEAYLNDDKAGTLQRLIVLENLGSDLKIPDLRRDFRRIIGEAYLIYDLSEEKAYEHLKDAVEIGSTIPEVQSDLLVKTGELAERLGRIGDAVDLYTRFCDSSVPNPRKAEITQRIERLKSVM